MVEKQSGSSHFDLIYGESLLPNVLQNLQSKTTSSSLAASGAATIRDKPIRRPDSNHTLNPHQTSSKVKKIYTTGAASAAEEEKKHHKHGNEVDYSDPSAANVPKNLLNKRKKKTLRKGGQQVWVDETLEEWAENDFRIFCGNMGNEVTDEVLANAFKKYASFSKAKVIRDKKTMKSKGFGFVSLLKVDDYIKAMREMQGKYVGNRPITLKRSQWQKKGAFNSSH